MLQCLSLYLTTNSVAALPPHTNITRLVLLVIFLWQFVFDCSSCLAQSVTGTFYPSTVGDIPEGNAPFRISIPTSDEPFLLGQSKALKEELRLRRRPYIRTHSAYSNQSLLNINGQLDTFTNGLEAGGYVGKNTKLSAFYLPTIFGAAALKSPRFFGEEYRIAVDGQPSNRFKYHSQLGLFHYAGNKETTPGLNVIGVSAASYRLHDWFRLSLGYRREILGNTVLSALGLKLPLNGGLVGRSTQNTFYTSLDSKVLGSKTFASVFYGGGFVDGRKEKLNLFQQGGLYVARPIRSEKQDAHLSYLMPSYNFIFIGYMKDFLEFGNLSRIPSNNVYENEARLLSSRKGLVQIPFSPETKHADVGGYFSPQKFFNNSFRLDGGGRILGPVYYNGGAGLGINNAKLTFSHLNQAQLVATANCSIYYRINNHLKFEHGWYYLQASNLYRRNILYTQTTYTF